MPLFEATPFTIALPSYNDYILGLQLTPIPMVTKGNEHIRSRQCHFFGQLLLLQLTPIVLVTICTERIRFR